MSPAKQHNLQKLDTIIDFTSVDFYPSFKVCDSLIEKVEKENCFRNTIYKKIGASLQKHTLESKDAIDETILVDLIINSAGEIIFKELQATKLIKNQLPTLDSLIRISVDQLPTIHPAIKRGIPVTSKYQLPIRIQLKELP
ncbi:MULTISPECIES: hypothetical protein [unclassified Polaribacter]|uniref:hypothetical protein n=1 Tax=unclassified Polaribacter TaxID=196858 RepID=UPI001CB8F224|nr:MULTISPECIES: hypothetical protein [unclassified Polaribacter]